MRLRKERQAAFRKEIDLSRRDGVLDGRHRLVEAHTEVRVVPRHPRTPELREEEPEVVADLLMAEGAIVDLRVDAEVARVRATHAPEHRDELDCRSFRERRLDELPAFADAGERVRLTRGARLQPERTVRRALT